MDENGYGAPLPPQAHQGRQPVPQTGYGQRPVSPPGRPLPEDPRRALVLVGVLWIFFALLVVYGFGLSSGLGSEVFYYVKYLGVALLACGAYLVAKADTLSRAVGWSIAVVEPLAQLLASRILSYTGGMYAGSGPRSGEYSLAGFAAYLADTVSIHMLQVFLAAAIVVATAFVLSLAVAKERRSPAPFVALCCGASYFFVNVLLSLAFRGNSGDGSLAPVVLGPLPGALALGLAVVLVYLLCTMRSHRIGARAGHKAWFWLCIVANAILLLAVAIGRMTDSPYFGYMGFAPTMLTLAFILGYVYLALSKRIGYLMIVLAAGISFFGSFDHAFSQALYSGGAVGGGWAGVWEAVIGNASSLINPLITGLVLLGIWRAVPPPAPAQPKPAVRVLNKAGAVVCIVGGALLFLLGSANYFLPFTMQYDGPPGIAFVAGVLFGAAAVVVGIHATMACFRKEDTVPRGLLRASLVIAVIAVALLPLVMVA